MPLFFVISGMSVFYRRRKLAAFLVRDEVRRIGQRLIVPYAVWCAIYIVLNLIINLAQGKNNWLYLFFGDCFAAVVERIPPLWFLATLFIAESFFFVLLKRLERVSSGRRTTLLGGVIVLAGAAMAVFDVFFKRISSMQPHIAILSLLMMVFRVAPALLFVIMGFLLAQITERMHAINKRTVLFTVMVVTAVCFLAVEWLSGNSANMYMFSFDDPIIFLISGTLGSVAVLCLAMLLPRNVRWLRCLGQKTVDVMALHYYDPMPFLLVFVVLEYRLIGTSPCLAASAASAWVCYKISVWCVGPLRKKCEKIYDRVRKSVVR